MQIPQLGTRFDAELLDQNAADVPIDLERLGSSPGAGQGPYQLGMQVLTQRVVVRQFT